MAWTRYPPSLVCTRLAALSFGLTTLGCIVNWFDDGVLGIASIVVLGVVGVAFTVAAHRLSRRSA